MDKIKWKKPWRTGTPTYGRYCGKNYTGGKIDGRDTSQKGVDVFDEACRRHDIAYQKNPKGTNWRADYKLAWETWKQGLISKDHDKLSLKEKYYVGSVPPAFAIKGTYGLARSIQNAIRDQAENVARDAQRKAFKLNGVVNDWALKKFNNTTRKVFKLTGEINNMPVHRAKRKLAFPAY